MASKILFVATTLAIATSSDGAQASNCTQQCTQPTNTLQSCLTRVILSKRMFGDVWNTFESDSRPSPRDTEMFSSPNFWGDGQTPDQPMASNNDRTGPINTGRRPSPFGTGSRPRRAPIIQFYKDRSVARRLEMDEEIPDDLFYSPYVRSRIQDEDPTTDNDKEISSNFAAYFNSDTADDSIFGGRKLTRNTLNAHGNRRFSPYPSDNKRPTSLSRLSMSSSQSSLAPSSPRSGSLPPSLPISPHNMPPVAEEGDEIDRLLRSYSTLDFDNDAGIDDAVESYTRNIYKKQKEEKEDKHEDTGDLDLTTRDTLSGARLVAASSSSSSSAAASSSSSTPTTLSDLRPYLNDLTAEQSRAVQQCVCEASFIDSPQTSACWQCDYSLSESQAKEDLSNVKQECSTQDSKVFLEKLKATMDNAANKEKKSGTSATALSKGPWVAIAVAAFAFLLNLN